MKLSRDKIQRMIDVGSGGSSGGVSSSELAGLLAGYATETWVGEHYISIDFFSRLFQAHGTENGSEIDVMPNDMETTITSVESMFGFWTNLYISALGSNGAAPAGISLGMLTDVVISDTPSAGQVLTYDAVSGKWINGNGGASSIATLTDVTLTSLQANQILIYDAVSQKWINSSVKTINGYSIFGTGDIPASGGGGGNYVAKAGDTMTGRLTINESTGTELFLRSSNTYSCINYAASTGANWSAGCNTDQKFYFWNSSTNSIVLDLLYDGKLHIYNQVTLDSAEGVAMDITTTALWACTTYRSAASSIGWAVGVQSDPAFFYFFNSYANRYVASIDRDGRIFTLKDVRVENIHEALIIGTSTNTSYVCTQYLTSTTNWSVGCDPDNFYIWNSYANTSNFVFTKGGRLGIQTTSPSYTVHVAGTIYATGAITALSDARKKDIIGEAGVTVEQIAHAPAVQFLWKDKERRKDGQQVGTLAQYWQTVLPEVVSDKGGELSMQYGVAALVSAIVTARKVIDHERRITELEKENERLKEEISQLRLN